MREATGLELAVVVADTHGRAWRVGIAGVAIGVAGLRPLHDYAGELDAGGTSCASPRWPWPTSWPRPPTW